MVSGIWERTCRRICRSMFSCMLTDLYCTSFSDYLRRISARRCLQSLQHRDGFDRRRSMRREYSLINDMIWLAFSLAWCGVLSYKASLPKVKELGLVFLFVFFLWVQRVIFLVSLESLKQHRFLLRCRLSSSVWPFSRSKRKLTSRCVADFFLWLSSSYFALDSGWFSGTTRWVIAVWIGSSTKKMAHVGYSVDLHILFMDFFKVAYLVYSCLGALIFSMYIVFDTQLMLGGKHK